MSNINDSSMDEERADAIESIGGLNVYGFVGNNSPNQVDELGLALYAIDGTWTGRGSDANPWQLYFDTTEQKYYHSGPYDGPGGLDSWFIARTVKKKICNDFCAAEQAGNNFTINLTGWSRGAIIAAGVAKMLNDEGCDCCKTHYQPVSVNWVGLFDAVAMTPGGWWPKAVPGNVAHFDHAVKTKEQRFLPTWHFTGNQTEEAFIRYSGASTSHRDIGESYKLGNNYSYIWIKSTAISAGVGF